MTVHLCLPCSTDTCTEMQDSEPVIHRNGGHHARDTVSRIREDVSGLGQCELAASQDEVHTRVANPTVMLTYACLAARA